MGLRKIRGKNKLFAVLVLIAMILQCLPLTALSSNTIESTSVISDENMATLPAEPSDTTTTTTTVEEDALIEADGLEETTATTNEEKTAIEPSDPEEVTTPEAPTTTDEENNSIETSILEEVTTTTTTEGADATIKPTVPETITTLEAPIISETPTTTDEENNSIETSIPEEVTNTITTEGADATIEPTFLEAATATDGTKILVTFDKDMAALPAAPAGFSVTVDGVDHPVQAVALNTNNTIVELTLTNTITTNAANIQLSYTAGTVCSADGGVLASFSNKNVINNVPVPAPAVPANIQATATTNSITLTWDNAANATAYEIEADGNIIDNGATTSYTYSALIPNSEHSFRVRSKNVNITSEWSNTITKCTLLEKPLNITHVIQGKEVTLTWDPVAGATSYNIYRNNEVIATNVANTTFTDSGLLEVINYAYEIEANNSAGNFSPKKRPYYD